MAYTIPDIISWAKICQPLAAVGEGKKKALSDDKVDEDLHIKLYDARQSLAWEYAQDPTSDLLHELGNYVLALCGAYLIQAQQTSIDGGLVIDAFTPTAGTTLVMPFYLVRPADFSSATEYVNAELDGESISVFGNFINRYLDSDEYSLSSGGLVTILIDGFDKDNFEAGKIILRIDVNAE